MPKFETISIGSHDYQIIINNNTIYLETRALHQKIQYYLTQYGGVENIAYYNLSTNKINKTFDARYGSKLKIISKQGIIQTVEWLRNNERYKHNKEIGTIISRLQGILSEIKKLDLVTSQEINVIESQKEDIQINEIKDQNETKILNISNIIKISSIFALSAYLLFRTKKYFKI